MSLGKLVYKYVFKPTLPLRYNLKHFGLAGWMNMRRGEQAMKKNAAAEPPINLCHDTDVITFCFLTGDKYWHQTIYAIKSLYQQLGNTFMVKIYSDGSLTATHVHLFEKFAPGMVFVSTKQVTDHLDMVLPKTKFPALRYLRDWHPFFQRMIDIHCNTGWAIHLDSDMLFFTQPTHLLNAFTQKQAVYMQELMDDSYFVDTESTLKEKYDMDCLQFVNGGIIAYNNDEVDYDDLETKAQLLIDNYPLAGPARIEQTLMSYLLYKQKAQALDKNQYTIFYDNKIETTALQTVRHYIFKAKIPYFTSEWKKINL